MTSVRRHCLLVKKNFAKDKVAGYFFSTKKRCGANHFLEVFLAKHRSTNTFYGFIHKLYGNNLWCENFDLSCRSNNVLPVKGKPTIVAVVLQHYFLSMCVE